MFWSFLKKARTSIRVVTAKQRLLVLLEILEDLEFPNRDRLLHLIRKSFLLLDRFVDTEIFDQNLKYVVSMDAFLRAGRVAQRARREMTACLDGRAT